jgi:hypothetical protein
MYWFTEAYHPHHFGMVKVQDEMGKVRYFIGNCTGRSESADAETIARWGAEINAQEAKEFFTHEIPESLRSKEIRDPTGL